MSPRFYTLLSMTLAAALARLLPHWPNFTPVGALALFGGAYFLRRDTAFAVPMAAMLLSDALLGMTRYGWEVWQSQLVVYACFTATVLIGMLLRNRRTFITVPAAAVASSVLFYAVTNFGYWYSETLYPHTAQGLLASYVAALSFFRNELAGNLFYTALLFGTFELAQRRWTVLGAARGWGPQESTAA